MPQHPAGSAPALLDPTPRTRLKRGAPKGSYDRATIHAILDEGLVCHVAFARGGQAFAIPTTYGRSGDELYLHGSTANRAFRALAGGAEACVAVTLLDGLVLARSAFHHSMNYRSVILYGRARAVREREERLEALRSITEHVVPGRWSQVRAPSEEELARTLIVALPIEEASAKLRSGPPIDDEEDYELPVWAGVLPLSVVPGTPVPDPRLAEGVPVPDCAARYRR